MSLQCSKPWNWPSATDQSLERSKKFSWGPSYLHYTSISKVALTFVWIVMHPMKSVHCCPIRWPMGQRSLLAVCLNPWLILRKKCFHIEEDLVCVYRVRQVHSYLCCPPCSPDNDKPLVTSFKEDTDDMALITGNFTPTGQSQSNINLWPRDQSTIFMRHWWTPIRAKQLSVALLFFEDDWGGD